jgi:spore coat protein U-like protein
MKLTKMCLFLASVTALAVGAGSPAFADTATPNLSVTATIAKACVITTNAVAFGTYDYTSGTPKPGTGGIVFNCTSGTAPTIQLSVGANGSGEQRSMANGSNTLNYTLYTNSPPTTPWETTVTVPGVDVGTVPVYGLIPINQNKPVGSYSDTVVATITF